ncbi:MAG: PEP-CTERM sorting domain-containing protein [Pirellulales bacterium]
MGYGSGGGWMVNIPELWLPDAGDIDMDRDVDVFDVAVLQAEYCGAGQWAAGDFNADDRVDIFDVAMMQVNFGRGVVAPPAVPEPASIALLAIGAGVVLAGWRFRRRRSRHAVASCRCATQTLSR